MHIIQVPFEYFFIYLVFLILFTLFSPKIFHKTTEYKDYVKLTLAGIIGGTFVFFLTILLINFL